MLTLNMLTKKVNIMAKLYSELNYDERLILLARNFLSGFISNFFGVFNILENELEITELAVLDEALHIIEKCYAGLD